MAGILGRTAHHLLTLCDPQAFATLHSCGAPGGVRKAQAIVPQVQSGWASMCYQSTAYTRVVGAYRLQQQLFQWWCDLAAEGLELATLPA